MKSVWEHWVEQSLEKEYRDCSYSILQYGQGQNLDEADPILKLSCIDSHLIILYLIAELGDFGIVFCRSLGLFVGLHVDLGLYVL
jgi:hypothetical protein